MELLIESGLLPDPQLSELLKETNEILAMTVALDQDSPETGRILRLIETLAKDI